MSTIKRKRVIHHTRDLFTLGDLQNIGSALQLLENDIRQSYTAGERASMAVALCDIDTLRRKLTRIILEHPTVDYATFTHLNTDEAPIHPLITSANK